MKMDQVDPQGEFSSNLRSLFSHLTDRHDDLPTLPTLPPKSAVASAISSLPITLPKDGLGTTGSIDYILNSILPGCLTAQGGPSYYGFVTGGVTPAAQLADILVGAYDENVQVTLPSQTAATAVEARVLETILDLMGIERGMFMGRTITTGATASNVLGLACAREYLYAHSPHLPAHYSFARSGPPSSSNLPSPPIVILALHPHFSILKAAALVGIGSGPNVVHSMPCQEEDELAFDLAALEKRLKEEKEVGRGVIVAYGLGEVNTGGFGRDLMKVVEMCKVYGAWLHIDAAFGGFASVVPECRYLVQGMEFADSLTLDGHKWLNVPYDCGLFYTRSAKSLLSVFAPEEAPAYLTAPSASDSESSGPAIGQVIHEQVPSPLYVNIENSRRFRALPLLASLMSLGKTGYQDLIRRNIQFARSIATYIQNSSSYDLLNPSPPSSGLKGELSSYDMDSRSEVESSDLTFGVENPIVPLNIVLFAPSSTSKIASGADLADAINATRKMYVTGTKWRGRSAVRLAVSNWRTGLGGAEEVKRIEQILDEVMR